jgi:hypothetical protein
MSPLLRGYQIALGSEFVETVYALGIWHAEEVPQGTAGEDELSGVDVNVCAEE